MQKSSSLTQKQINQLLFQYIQKSDQKLHQLISLKMSKYPNLSRKSILYSLTAKIKSFILDLQKSLWMAKKINQLRIYDHQSEFLFDAFTMNLVDIIPENCIADFIQLYKNSMLNSIEIIWQVQYAFVHTDKKVQIYNGFIEFMQKQNLFMKSRMQQKDPTQVNYPQYMLDRIFPIRDLQLILKTFKQKSFDVIRTYRQLKVLKLQTHQYKNLKQFVVRFDNLLLIGLYTMYQFICQKKERKPLSFIKFVANKFKNINFQRHLYSLLRVAIRRDPFQQELIFIQLLLSQRQFFKYQKRVYKQIEQRQQTIKVNVQQKPKCLQVKQQKNIRNSIFRSRLKAEMPEPAPRKIKN